MGQMNEFVGRMMVLFKRGRILAFIVRMGMHHEFTIAQQMDMHKNDIVNNEHTH